MGVRLARRLAVLLATFGLFSGCGASPTSPTPTITRFQGTLAGTGGQSGTVDITVQTATAARAAFSFPSFVEVLHAQGPVSAGATITLVTGSTASLTGTYNGATKGLNLSGGGFTLIGTLNGVTVAGSVTGPGGTTGAFSSLNATSAAVTVYCGTFQSLGGTEIGVWNLEVTATGAASGVVGSNLSPASVITGQVNGNTLTLTGATGGGATGMIGGGVVTGTGSHDTVFAGSTSSCNLPPSSTNPTSPTTAKTYVGAFNGQIAIAYLNPNGKGCATAYTFIGTMSISLDQRSDGVASGTAQTNLTTTLSSAPPGNCGRGTSEGYGWTATVTGTPGNLVFSKDNVGSSTITLSFSGALTGTVISGTAVWTEVDPALSGDTNGGSTTFTVTLR
jgi:hypothetical protein